MILCDRNRHTETAVLIPMLRVSIGNTLCGATGALGCSALWQTNRKWAGRNLTSAIMTKNPTGTIGSNIFQN